MSMGIMGSMLPRTQTGNTFERGAPIQRPTGMAPLSSITGRADRKARIWVSDRPEERSLDAIRTPTWGLAEVVAAVEMEATTVLALVTA